MSPCPPLSIYLARCWVSGCLTSLKVTLPSWLMATVAGAGALLLCLPDKSTKLVLLLDSYMHILAVQTHYVKCIQVLLMWYLC